MYINKTLRDRMHAKTYEPNKRWCGGSYGWVCHRFPVKNGISWLDVFCNSNVLLSSHEAHPTFRGIPIILTDTIGAT